MSELTVVKRHFVDLSVEELYAILRLRCDVFVVEQQCPYPDLDGRDGEPGTQHVWLHDRDQSSDHTIAAYLRILVDPDTMRIGRVVTDPTRRGEGLARRLMVAALDMTTGPVVLDAQAYLEAFYASFGFVVTGAAFVEDGIPHVPMRLERKIMEP